MTDYPQLWRPTGKGHSSLLVKGRRVLAYVSPVKMGGEEGKVDYRVLQASGLLHGEWGMMRAAAGRTSRKLLPSPEPE